MTGVPQWPRVRQILEDALEKPEPDRRRFIAEACGDDAALYDEVASLMASTDAASTFIERPPDWLAAEVLTLQPGTQVDHYRIVDLLGRGGMGDVYLADDAELDRRVALKFLAPEVAGSSERLQRFEQEARAASALSHPNIVTIHGICRIDSGPVLVTEYIEGRTLRQHIADGPLDLSTAIDIALQISAALAAAHRAGITHRDLKPDNVMVRHDGLVKLLDFGLARRDGAPSIATPGRRGPGLTDPGTVMGTASYMSPEQAGGLEVGPQSDLFSLGSVLYELVTGHRPFPGDSTSEVLSAVLAARPPLPMKARRPDVPDALQAIVAKLLCKETSERYATADAVIADLDALRRHVESANAPHSRPRIRWMIGGAAAAVAMLGAIIYFVQPSAALTDSDVLLLTNFDNQTGDSELDDVLEQALAVQLEQSPFLSIFPQERVRETLRLMKQPEDVRIGRQIGLEVARRQGVKVLLAGSIHSVGSHYAIGLEAIAAESGTAVAREQAEAKNKEGVLAALAQTTTRMRRKLGESLPSIRQFDAPIEQATTASLEALRAYDNGLQLANRGQGIAAIQFYRRAVDIDPEFALAWSQLANGYSSAGMHPLKIAAGNRAFALRERVSERERFHIESDYYTNVTRELQRAIQVYLLWAKTYPRDSVPVAKLGSRYLSLGRYEAAVEQLRAALRLHPDDRALLQNLARALLRLNRFDEAEGVLQSARERQLETPQMRQTRFDLAFVRGDTTTIQQAVTAARGSEDEYDRTFNLGEIAAFGGRFDAAQERFRDAAALAAARKRPPQYAGWALARIALSQASLGRCKEVPASVQQALAISKYPGVVRIAIWALVRCGLTTEARHLHDELTGLDSRDDATAGESVLEETHALILVGGYEPARALELLKASPNDQAFEHLWLRGQSLLAMKDGAAAAAEFRRIVDNRGGGPTSVLWPLAHLGLARALVLTGAVDEGGRRYQQFLELWKDADADAVDLVAARREYRSLPTSGNR